jgi:hypothetical protein
MPSIKSDTKTRAGNTFGNEETLTRMPMVLVLWGNRSRPWQGLPSREPSVVQLLSLIETDFTICATVPKVSTLICMRMPLTL